MTATPHIISFLRQCQLLMPRRPGSVMPSQSLRPEHEPFTPEKH
jgi:hypothetical protein